MLLWFSLLSEAKPPYFAWIFAVVSHWFLCFSLCHFSYCIFNSFTKLYISLLFITPLSGLVSHSKGWSSWNGSQGQITLHFLSTAHQACFCLMVFALASSICYTFLPDSILFCLSRSSGHCSNITSSESLSVTNLADWASSTLLIPLTLLYFTP